MVEQSLELGIGVQLPLVPSRDMLVPSEHVYNALRTCNITALEACSPRELLPVLPSLVRLALCPPLDKSDFWYRQSKRFIPLISSHPAANLISALSAVDFSALEADTVKSVALIQKLSSVDPTPVPPPPSLLVGTVRESMLLDFERSGVERKMRLLTAELVRLLYQADSYIGDKYAPSELLMINPYLPLMSQLLVQLTHQLPALLQLPELCEALIKVECGAELVCCVAANNPNAFESILYSLLSRDESQEDQLQYNPLRMKALCLLCAMSPAYFSAVRSRCVRHKSHLTVALILALEEARLATTPSLGELTEGSGEIELPSFSLESLSAPAPASDPVLNFLSSVLLGDSDESSWVTLYLKQALRKNVPSRVFSSVNQQIINRLIGAIPGLRVGGKEGVSFRSPPPEPADTESPLHAESEPMQTEGAASRVCVLSLSPSQLTLGASVLRVFCLLRRLCPLPPHHLEADVILSLIVAPALCTSHCGLEFLKVALGALLLCPVFYSGEKEELVLEWYRRLLLTLPTAESQLRELLLTIYSLSHASNNQPLTDLLSDIMSIPHWSKPYQISKSKDLFLRVFTDDKCSQMILSLPPTPNLNANHTDKFSIQSLLDFLKKKTLPSSLQPTQWILNQVMQCTLPLHPTILLILKEYTSVILREAQKSTSATSHLLFPADDIISVYASTSLLHNDNLAPQLLLLFYLLTLCSDETLPPSSPVLQYAISALEHVPIKMLLSKAITHSTECSELYPLLLKLVLDSLPQLWLPQNVLREVNCLQSGMKLETKCIPAHFEKTMNQKNPNLHIIFVLLKQLLSLHLDKLRGFMSVLVQLIPALLSPSIARQTQNTFLTLWERIESVEPRRLWLATANRLSEGERELTHDDLAFDPLLILNCDPRVFRTPPIYSLLLDTLVAYLAASRVHLFRIERQRELQGTTPPSSDVIPSYELTQTIISTQESATIQLLIDVCIPSEEDRSTQSPFGMQLTNLTEIQCLSCCLISQMLIADPNLARIIHSQGYPSQMIEMLVQGVPPMHICIDFIPSLLEETENTGSIVFCVQLTASLCEQYPLPKAIGVCQKVLEFLNRKVRQLNNAGRSELFRPMLTSLIHFAKTFPTLSEEITLLLLLILKLEQATVPTCVESRDASLEGLEGAASLSQAVADTFDVLLDQVVLKL